MTRQVLAGLLVLPLALGLYVDPAHPDQAATSNTSNNSNAVLPPAISDFHDLLNSIQAQVDVASARGVFQFAQVSQWLHGNITAVKQHMMAAAEVLVTKAQLRRAIRKLKKDLEKKPVPPVTPEPSPSNPATPVVAPVSPKPTAVVTPVAPKTQDTAVNNTSDLATQVALLQVQLSTNISQITQQVQSTFANLASAIQGFQISTSNLNATVNGQSGQITYLSNRLDNLQNTLNNQVMSLGSYMANNVTMLSQYLSQAVFGTETNLVGAKYKIYQNKAPFLSGTPNDGNPDQLVVVVPFTASFASAPAVAVSMVANQGAAPAAYSFYVKAVSTAAATIVVSLDGGAVHTTDPYSVAVIAYGS